MCTIKGDMMRRVKGHEEVPEARRGANTLVDKCPSHRKHDFLLDVKKLINK
jgi:hypothetical protein